MISALAGVVGFLLLVLLALLPVGSHAVIVCTTAFGTVIVGGWIALYTVPLGSAAAAL